MKKLRTYGESPFRVAVIHGGPGAPGEMAPVARELAAMRGVLEPLQTQTTLKGQVAELGAVLEEKGDPPVTLIGYSWGAWLAFLLAAERPILVKKLVLVGSGPFEEVYVSRILETRLNRLTERERGEIERILDDLARPGKKVEDDDFSRFGALLSKADTFDADADDGPGLLDCQAETFQSVWREAEALRRTGELLEQGNRIRCPVVAVHGDFDPHPAEGVLKPLAATLKDFHMHILDRCGHKPWIERHGRERFYEILERELGSGGDAPRGKLRS
ncbi:MAG: alpha/beta fold hydrolase [Planctomycetota bacterium]